MYAHRFAYSVLVGPIPEGLFVCHSCDNPACVNPEHLFLGTSKDNNQDCARKGRNKASKGRGIANIRAKLTESDVLAIRAIPKEIKNTHIAKQYGVSDVAVSYIRLRRTWRHI